MRIIGCGNRDRGDDGAGILVAERLCDLGIDAAKHSGEAVSLVEAWEDTADVVVIDAVVTGRPAGTIQVWEGEIPSLDVRSSSTHGLGVGEAVRLASALGRLPARLRIFGIEGARFDVGTGPSFEVLEAVEQVAGRLAAESVGQEWKDVSGSAR